MPRTTLPFAIASAICLMVGHGAAAQNSTAAPLSSTKEDTAGDPSGAIKALENSSEGKRSAPVTISKLDGETPKSGSRSRDDAAGTAH